MEHKSNKALSLLLVTLLLVPLLNFIPVSQAAGIVKSGNCGESASFELDSDGNLYISGTGTVSSTPWNTGGKPSVKKAFFTDGITNVPDGAFNPWCYGNTCDDFEYVELSDSITTIGTKAFSACKNLSNIILPSSLTIIGDKAFSGCNFNEIIFPLSLTGLWKESLSHCEKLSRVIFPKYCEIPGIGNDAFTACKALEHIALPVKLKSLGSYVFSQSGLKTVFWPKSLKSIGWYCFPNSFTDVYYEGTEEEWKQINVDYGYNRNLAPAKVHYGSTFEEYMREYYHMIIVDSGVINGIRMIASINSDEYTFRNHVLYDAQGNQVDKVTINVTVTNIDNSNLETDDCCFNATPNPSFRGILKNTSIETKINIGESKHFYVEYDADDLLYGSKGVEKEIKNNISIHNSTEIEEDYFEVIIKEFSFAFDFSLSEAKYIRGFQMGRDSYRFTNWYAHIDYSYYKHFYGPYIADFLYSSYEIPFIKKGHGVCYGIANTAAALFMDQSKLNAFSAENTVELLPENRSIMGYTVEDYIKYMHIAQFNVTKLPHDLAPAMLGESYSSVLNLVKQHLNSNLSPVPLSFSKHTEGGADHTVLAIGVEGDDIIIYDSNETEAQRIFYFDGKWYYNSYNSDNCALFTNEIPVIAPIAIPSMPDVLEIGFTATDAIRNMIVTEYPDLIPEETLYRIRNSDTASEDEEGDSCGGIYWIEDYDVSITNTIDKTYQFKMLSKDRAFDINLPVASTAQLSIAPEEKASFVMKTATATDVEFTYSEVYDAEPIDIHISGTAAGNNVSMEETEAGIFVNGLNKITVSVTDKEEEIIAETTARIEDGRSVNIFVEPENNAVSTDFIEEQPELPDEPQGETDNLCPFCHKDHGGTFWGRLVAFFHRILYFFAHLFGKM